MWRALQQLDHPYSWMTLPICCLLAIAAEVCNSHRTSAARKRIYGAKKQQDRCGCLYMSRL